jgi:WD40-like Beta Propeller Repeat
VKGRDLLILAAVVLIGGLAVADSLRSDGDVRPAADEPATTATTVTPAPDEDLGRESFPAVPGAGGGLVVTQAGSCAVREFDLPTGLEFRNVVARSSCELWAAPVTAKVAVGVGQGRGDAVPFRFIDLSRPGRNLGTSEALFGFLVWSPDGQRAAWCNRRRTAIDFEVGQGRRLLSECPAGYTLENEVLYAADDSLVVDDRTVLTASGVITAVNVGADGSFGVVVEGRRIERYQEGELTDVFELEERLEGRLPVLSPDNCSVVFRAGDRVQLFDVGCSPFAGSSSLFPGHVATWSPDGRWLAVGGATDLTFYDLEGGRDPVEWEVGVVEIAWRRG